MFTLHSSRLAQTATVELEVTVGTFNDALKLFDIIANELTSRLLAS